jgi:formiminotetrahydrofolate cyclodeaminase
MRMGLWIRRTIMSTSEQTVPQFLEALASAAPAPGGGAACALSGAMGAALVSMVANLTLARELTPDRQAALTATLREADALRRQLTELMAADARAYDAVIAAYRLPRASAAERAMRRPVIEAALQQATLTPLEIADRCARIVALAEPAARLGISAAASDAAAAAFLAEAGARACLLNVEINLASIKDVAFSEQASARAAALVAALPALRDAALAAMRAALQPPSKGA